MANAPEKRFTYDVGDVEEEPTMFQKSGVQPADMAKHLELKLILGGLKIFAEKEFAKIIVIEKADSSFYQF